MKVLGRLLRSLWRSGLLSLRWSELPALGRAWWKCRAGYAFLAEAAAIRWPARLALRDEEGPLTFAQLHQQSLALAGRLQAEAGLGAGAQVGLLAANHRGFVLGLLACTRLGVDVLPLNPDLPPRVLEQLLSRQGIEGLLCDRDLPGPFLHWPWLCHDLPARDESLPNLKKGGELVVLTSGTSGIAKGVRRRPALGDLLPLAAGLLDSLQLTVHRPAVLAIPLYHGYGLAALAMALALGSPLHMARRYEITPLMDRLESGERPLLISVPTLLKRWLAAGGKGRPVAVITGSAPLDSELCVRLLEHLGPVLFNLYGSSEAGLISLALPEELRRAPGSVGRPLPGNTVRLVDVEDRPVSPGEVGRILARGPFVLPQRPDGWRDTGDLGRQEGEILFVCGRADAMIVSGGENVYPHEVEALLLSHPEVEDAVVWAVSDEQFGRRLAAAVTARIEVEALRAWLKERLERHKMPRDLHALDKIPRGSLGKVDRVELERRLSG